MDRNRFNGNVNTIIIENTEIELRMEGVTGHQTGILCYGLLFIRAMDRELEPSRLAAGPGSSPR